MNIDDGGRLVVARAGLERSRAWWAASAILLVVALIGAPTAMAAPGDPDTTFSGDGLLTFDFGQGGDDSVRDAAAQSDGKVVAVGRVGGENGAFGVIRLTSAGAFDSSFSDDGRTVTPFEHGLDGGASASAVGLQSDGKIVVAGGGFDGFALARYSPDGTLDPSFGTGGKTTTARAGNEDDEVRLGTAHALAIQADGKIVVGGEGDGDFAIARYNSNGSLDTGFDGDGVVTTSIGAGDSLSALALQADGKIVAVGTAFTSTSGETSTAGLVRLNATGALDTTFSGDGKQTTKFGEGIALQGDGKLIVAGGGLARYASNGSPDPTFSGDGEVTDGNLSGDVAVQSDQKILVSGLSRSGDDDDAAVARYSSGGALDTTFSDDGYAVSDFGGQRDSVSALLLQPDGKVVIGGVRAGRPAPTLGGCFCRSAGLGDFALARFGAAGSLDPGFSADGVITADFPGDDRARGVLIQPDGKVVATGASGGQFGLARWTPTGTADSTFSGDGSARTSFGTDSDADATDLVLQPDGKAVVVGSVSVVGPSSEQREFAIARFNPDGSLDSTFSDDGRQTTNFSGSQSRFAGADAVVVAPDGKIVVSGIVTTNTDGSSQGAAAVARYVSDGSLDASFGSNGIAMLNDLGRTYGGHGTDIAVAPDGKILLTAEAEGEAGWTAARLTAGGSPDRTFSGDGVVTTDFGADSRPVARSVALQSDGRIVVAGEATQEFVATFAVARYLSDGTLDTSFSVDGRESVAFAGAFGSSEDSPASEAADVHIQGDGSIIAAGRASAYVDGVARAGLAMARIDAVGSLDAGFSGDGKVVTELSGMTGGARSLASRGDRIVVAGDVDSGADYDFGVAAYQGGGSPTSPTGDGGAGGPGGGASNPAAAGGGTGGGPTLKPSVGGGMSPRAPSIGGSAAAGTATASAKGFLTVPKQSVDCTGSGPDCSVSAIVSGSVPAGTASARAKKKAKVVKLGASSFKVKAGKKGAVTVKLTKKGLKLLKRLRKVKAKVTITVKRGGVTRKKTVTVTLKAPKGKP